MPETLSGPGQLARRWGNWAGNLLVSAIVLVVALSLGREVVHWWYTKPVPLTMGSVSESGLARSPVVSDPLGWPETSEELRFGELPFAFGHGTVEGNAERAIELLRRECDKAAAQADAAERMPGTAEKQLLARLQHEEPVSLVGSRWSTYVITRPVPMTVAVSGTKQTPSERRRVLAWGLLLPEHRDEPAQQPEPSPIPPSASRKSAAIPDSVQKWGWFTWRPSRSDTSSGAAGESWPQLPEGQRTMSIRTVDGGVRLAYHGSGTPDRWRDAFDRWFGEHGWYDPAVTPPGSLGSDRTSGSPTTPSSGSEAASNASPWQKIGSTWSRRYHLPPHKKGKDSDETKNRGGSAGGESDRPGAGTDRGGQEAEVQVLADRSGALRAIMIVSPSAAGR